MSTRALLAVVTAYRMRAKNFSSDKSRRALVCAVKRLMGGPLPLCVSKATVNSGLEDLSATDPLLHCVHLLHRTSHPQHVSDNLWRWFHEVAHQSCCYCCCTQRAGRFVCAVESAASAKHTGLASAGCQTARRCSGRYERLWFRQLRHVAGRSCSRHDCQFVLAADLQRTLSHSRSTPSSFLTRQRAEAFASRRQKTGHRNLSGGRFFVSGRSAIEADSSAPIACATT